MCPWYEFGNYELNITAAFPWPKELKCNTFVGWQTSGGLHFKLNGDTCSMLFSTSANAMCFMLIIIFTQGQYVFYTALLWWIRFSPTYSDWLSLHDDVVKWKHFPRYRPFVRGIHLSPVNSPHKGQWRRALTFSLICVWINGWVNNREASHLRRNQAHYDVIVMVNYSLGGLKYIMLIIWYELFQLQSYSCMLILQDTRLDGPIMCTYEINVSNISVKLLYIIYSIRVKVLKWYQVVTDVGIANGLYPGVFLLLTLTLVPAWRSNQILGKGWYENIYPFQNIKDCTVEVWVRISNFIPHFIIDVITNPCWD